MKNVDETYQFWFMYHLFYFLLKELKNMIKLQYLSLSGLLLTALIESVYWITETIIHTRQLKITDLLPLRSLILYFTTRRVFPMRFYSQDSFLGCDPPVVRPFFRLRWARVAIGIVIAEVPTGFVTCSSCGSYSQGQRQWCVVDVANTRASTSRYRCWLLVIGSD